MLSCYSVFANKLLVPYFNWFYRKKLNFRLAALRWLVRKSLATPQWLVNRFCAQPKVHQNHQVPRGRKKIPRYFASDASFAWRYWLSI